MHFVDNFGKLKRPMSLEEFYHEQQKFDSVVETYAEFPPLWSGPTRFNIDASKYGKLTLAPIFDLHEVSILSLDLEAEAKRYTHIVYVKVRNGK
jgi:hypothetical protein